MILTFTDFGWQGPYLGEMRAAALRVAPTVPYVDLMADAPAFRPDLAAYLLAALAPRRWRDDVVIAVVDPGVGTERAPLAVRVNDVWFVGPDNGLFELLIRRTDKVLVHEITLRPKELSASFHGRDIFAPMAGRIAAGKLAGLKGGSVTRYPDWPDELDRIVHIDTFGNLVTGRRAATVPPGTVLAHGEQRILQAAVFGAVPPGSLFWYANSCGLLEIARNQGSAAGILGLAVGDSAPVAT
jgi:S-adenosyl-L-methionine hydrolase (adenosine-forming)